MSELWMSEKQIDIQGFKLDYNDKKTRMIISSIVAILWLYF